MPAARTTPVTAHSALESRLRALDKEQLRPDASAVRLARERAEGIVTRLHEGKAQMYEVDKLVPHGSLHRGTALANFNDIDFLVVLNEEALKTIRGEKRPARDTVERMTREIRDRHRGLVNQGHFDVRSQGHSVGVFYSSGLRIDLVPALPIRGGFEIPRRETNEWIETRPARTKQRLEKASALVRHVKIATRLIKGWRRARGKNVCLPSYAIEVLVVDRALKHQEDLVTLVYNFFSTIANHDARYRLQLLGSHDDPPPVLVKDPDSDANLTDSLSGEDRKALVAACRGACDALDELLEKLEGNPDARINTLLSRLFVGTW